MTWVNVQEFRDRTNIGVLSEDEINRYLETAARVVRDKCFRKMITNVNTDENNAFKLPMHNMYLGDGYTEYDSTSENRLNWNIDGKITKKDINIFQKNETTYIKTSKSDNISSFVEEEGYVVMDGQYPDVENESVNVYVEYYLCRMPFAQMYESVKDLQILLALRRMLPEKPFAAAALMTSDVSIAGFSFNSGVDNIQETLVSLGKFIVNIFRDIQPLQVRRNDGNIYDFPFMSRRL